MVVLDEDKVKKVKLGDLIGYICLAVAAAGAIFFAVCYPIARVQNLNSLLNVTYIFAPVLIIIGATGAAICNIKFGGENDRLIHKYVLDVCLENPEVMHPERDSLTFFIELEDCKFVMRTNGYNEGLTFDFSAFKRLGPMRKSEIATEICNRLIISFCRLYKHGSQYREVNYVLKTSGKEGKNVPIIVDGKPDPKAYKIYLKTKH